MFIVISMNIALLFTILRTKTILMTNENEKIELGNQIKRHKNYLDHSMDSFCLTKRSILSTSAMLGKTIQEKKEIYVTVIPPNACNACISSLFTEVVSSGVDVTKLFLLIDNDSNLLLKEWISFGFSKSNCIIDRLGLIKNCHLNKTPVFVKLYTKNENCIFLNYEPGVSITAKHFIKTNIQ